MTSCSSSSTKNRFHWQILEVHIARKINKATSKVLDIASKRNKKGVERGGRGGGMFLPAASHLQVPDQHSITIL